MLPYIWLTTSQSKPMHCASHCSGFEFRPLLGFLTGSSVLKTVEAMSQQISGKGGNTCEEDIRPVSWEAVNVAEMHKDEKKTRAFQWLCPEVCQFQGSSEANVVGSFCSQNWQWQGRPKKCRASAATRHTYKFPRPFSTIGRTGHKMF